MQRELADGKAATVKIKFIDSIRFMARSLSNFADNHIQGIHKGK